MYATISILAALNARSAGAGGQHVQVGLYTTGISLLANVASNALVSGKPAGRYGNGHPNIVPYRSFNCRDAAVAVAVGNDMQFVAFCKAIGEPGWPADPRFTKNADRVRSRAAIDGLIEAKLAGEDKPLPIGPSTLVIDHGTMTPEQSRLYETMQAGTVFPRYETSGLEGSNCVHAHAENVRQLLDHDVGPLPAHLMPQEMQPLLKDVKTEPER